VRQALSITIKLVAYCLLLPLSCCCTPSPCLPYAATVIVRVKLAVCLLLLC
jgi:hypothetical protein